MAKWGEMDPYPGRMKHGASTYTPIVHVHVCLLPTRRGSEVMSIKVHVFCVSILSLPKSIEIRKLVCTNTPRAPRPRHVRICKSRLLSVTGPAVEAEGPGAV